MDLKYPLEFGLMTLALSIGSTFAWTTPFSLRLETANNNNNNNNNNSNNNNQKNNDNNNIIIIKNKRQKQIT